MRSHAHKFFTRSGLLYRFVYPHQVLCRPIQWIRSHFTIAKSSYKFTAKIAVNKCFVSYIAGLCKLYSYILSPQLFLGCECTLTLLRLSQLQLDDIISLSTRVFISLILLRLGACLECVGSLQSNVSSSSHSMHV